MGLIGIHHWDKANQKAEIGYWLGKEFWNKGYVTEAMAEVLAFGFKVLNLNKMFANFFPHNPASGRVMEKSGMRQRRLSSDRKSIKTENSWTSFGIPF